MMVPLNFDVNFSEFLELPFLGLAARNLQEDRESETPFKETPDKV